MATKMTKSSIVKSKPATSTTTAPKVSRARKSDTAGDANAVMMMREQIAVRAYEMFTARGYQHGHDVEDWLRAEAELTQRQ
jgi:hypothetical protein